MRQYILLDVGGTGIKGAAAAETGQLLTRMEEFPARSNEEAEAIFQNLLEVIGTLAGAHPSRPLAGIGFAFPGPFDYEHGVSGMRGIGKYDSIYGLSIPRELRARQPGLAPVPLRFLHDVEAFALGCVHGMHTIPGRKVLCVCIGTGAGSAFVVDGIVQKMEGGGVPEHGWIYNTPYRCSILDDYLSVRGLADISCEVFGSARSGRELSALSANGDRQALEVYRRFGEIAEECLRPFLTAFAPDVLLLGGQISRGFAFYGDALKKTCNARGIEIIIEPETSRKALQGLLHGFEIMVP